jgi:MFS family permease
LGINIGFSIGPVIAGFLYKNYITWVFLGNAIAAFTALILVAFFVKETMPDKTKDMEDEASEDEKSQEGSALKLLFERPQLLIFALLATVYTFAYSQGNFSTTIQLKGIFGDNASKMLGGIQAVNGIVVISMTTFIVYLTKKNKPIFNIALSGVFFATGFGMQYFISSYPWFIIATIIWTLGEVLNATSNGVYIADHAPKTHRGRFNSILSMITGAGSAVGPYIMGGYIQDYGVRMVWPLVYGLTMMAAASMYLLYRFEIKKEKHRKIAME